MAQLHTDPMGARKRSEAGYEYAWHRKEESPQVARRLELMAVLGYTGCSFGEPTLKQLIAYLRENLILDFQGEASLDIIRGLLADDDSREARTLLTKLVEERGVDEMMLVLADTLVDNARKALNDDTFREHLRTYSES